MMESPQIVVNSPLNLPPPKQPQKLADVVPIAPPKLMDVTPTAPSRIFKPASDPELVKIAGPMMRIQSPSKTSPPKLPLPHQSNGKITYVFKPPPPRYVTPMNAQHAAPPTFTVSGYRAARPMVMVQQNPFRPGLYIRSPSKPMLPPAQLPRIQQRMIRVIQPATHTILMSPPSRQQPHQHPVQMKILQPSPMHQSSQIQVIDAPNIAALPITTIVAPPIVPSCNIPEVQPAPIPKKIFSPPKDYPGEVKRIFLPMIEKAARCTSINWKQYREEYKDAKTSEVKILKPWDIHYQPLSTKQRAAKSILQVEKPQATSISLNSQIGPAGPLTEKNAIIVKSPPKKLVPLKSVTPEKIRKRKIEVDDKEMVKKKLKKFSVADDKKLKKLKKIKEEIVEPRFFSLRISQEEYALTVRQDNLSAEDFVYNHIAFNRLLAQGELNFLADMRLPSDPQEMTEMLAMIKSTNAKCFKVAAYLDGKTKVPKEAPVLSKFLPLPDVPTEEEEKINPREWGCARIRPFVRKTNSVSPTRKRVGKRFTVITKEDEENMKRAVVRGKNERHFTRQILTQLQIEQPELAKLDIFKSTTTYYKFLKHAKSPIHGDGLFALAPIESDQMIIEYTGEKIRHEVANIRERKYEKQGLFSSYMFRLDNDYVIDATKMGNLARFINHCCQPNCTARVVSRNGVKRIFIFSKSYIEKGEELTYDYKFPLEDNKIRCHCGAKFCRNYLN